jgi:hypothetical protein
LDRDVLRFHPDVVIVTLGTNDSNSSTLEEFKENYLKLLTILKENVPAVITRTSNPAIDMKTGLEDPSWNASKPEFMAAIVEISNQLEYETDRDIFFNKLKQVGYSYNEVYDNYVYNFVKHSTYIVNNEFPRIKADDLPKGIAKVQYEVLLSLIEKNREE